MDKRLQDELCFHFIFSGFSITGRELFRNAFLFSFATWDKTINAKFPSSDGVRTKGTDESFPDICGC